MKNRAIFFFAALMISALANAAGYISFTPGPDFTTRVNTPWGNYIVDMEPDGGAAWVGTEEEYTTRKAIGAAGPGHTEMRVEGQDPHSHTIINTLLPRVFIRTMEVAEIQVSLSLDDHSKPDPSFHFPPERSGYQYVFMNWTASRQTPIRVALADPKLGRTFEPFYCDIGSCKYQIPNAEAGVPLVAIFTTTNSRPSALAIKSLANFQYEVQLAFKMPADVHMLEQLHAIDPTVPINFSARAHPTNTLDPDMVRRVNESLARIEKTRPTWGPTSDREMRLWQDKPEYQALLTAQYSKSMRMVSGALPTSPRGVPSARGKVLVSFVVGTDGNVEAARVLESSDPRFDAAAIDAVMKFKFVPAEGYNGAARQMSVLPFDFTGG